MKTILIIMSLALVSLTSLSQKVINAVHFGFDVHALTSQNKEALDKLIPLLSDANITLKGYTDFIGSTAYNAKLSTQRVNAVKAYLLAKGVNETSIKQSIGLGELTEFNDRAKNRRVDVFVTETVKEVIEVEDVEIIEEVEEPKFLSAEKIGKLEVGETIALENMEFIPGRHYLKEYAKPTLIELLEIMQGKPNLKIEVQGHICCDYTGDDGLDFDTQTNDLSKNRAKFIYDYLIREGIASNRISYKGFGSSRPLVKEVTEEDQQRNRRVEIMIIEK